MRKQPHATFRFLFSLDSLTAPVHGSSNSSSFLDYSIVISTLPFQACANGCPFARTTLEAIILLAHDVGPS